MGIFLWLWSNPYSIYLRGTVSICLYTRPTCKNTKYVQQVSSLSKADVRDPQGHDGPLSSLHLYLLLPYILQHQILTDPGVLQPILVVAQDRCFSSNPLGVKRGPAPSGACGRRRWRGPRGWPAGLHVFRVDRVQDLGGLGF